MNRFQTETADRHARCGDRHEWVVYSTALDKGWLMLQCVNCGAHGTVDHPTKEEWSDAFRAPSKPFHWLDSKRVTHRGIGSAGPYVIRATRSAECECYQQGLAIRPGEYERFPAEICRQTPAASASDRTALDIFADGVSLIGICSYGFAPVVANLRDMYGVQSAPGVVEAARRIEGIHEKGMHLSPGVVAEVLRFFAGTGE